jgi:hypothetical protein
VNASISSAALESRKRAAPEHIVRAINLYHAAFVIGPDQRGSEHRVLASYFYYESFRSEARPNKMINSQAIYSPCARFPALNGSGTRPLGEVCQGPGPRAALCGRFNTARVSTLTFGY